MALPELLANSPTPGTRAAVATLTAELKNEAGALTLKLSGALPTILQGPGQTRLTIDNEIMLVTAAAGTEITVLERAVEGSTKAAHLVGASVYALPTQEGLRLAGLSAGSVKVITTDKEMWKKPVGAQSVTVICIGAGGGGGGGAHGKSGTICTGGGGGSGGSIATWTFVATALATEVECRVNTTAAAGGVGFETEKAGEDGKNGVASKFGTLLTAEGGNLGKGGAITGVAAKGGALAKGMFPGNAAGECAATGKATNALSSESGCGGGGGGGGITVTPTAESGGTGSNANWNSATNAAGGVAGEAGKAGPEPGKEEGLPGGGGGGGGASTASAATGKGGAGGLYGGGGGGGGATVKAAQFSGAGGEGGKGAVIIITH